MHIVGLNHGEINSSAALVRDGRLLSACAEERFNRQKRTRAFPAQSLAFCLQQENLELADCDAVAQAWNPGAAWEKYNPVISSQRVKREDYFYSVPDNLFSFSERTPPTCVKMEMVPEESLPPLYFVQHHRCHSANAFYLSDFDEAALLTCDWRGEFESTTFARGTGEKIEFFQSQSIPHSLGMFYGTFTELLGYRPDSDEWKVMALAAFNVDCEEMLQKIRSTFRLGEDGMLELDQSYYKGAIIDQPKNFTTKLVRLLGGRVGVAGEEPDEWHLKIARAMQLVSEEIGFHFLNHLWELTKCPNLAVSGGFFMNSVLNGKIISNSPFEKLYVSYCPGDLGNSIGAALYIAHNVLGEERTSSFNQNSYIGPEFSDREILESLDRRGIAHQLQSNISDTVAKLLSEGNVVAVCNGAMEFGERALGNRSILADPRKAEMKDRINSMIKYRESYRPFAPATLVETADKFFDVDTSYRSPYMEKVCQVREEYQQVIPAITHVDGSARLQTVCERENPGFYQIIKKFGQLTGLPVVLNTSFNINNEPIVLSPDDAISTFFNSGLTHLAVGNYLVTKS